MQGARRRWSVRADRVCEADWSDRLVRAVRHPGEDVRKRVDNEGKSTHFRNVYTKRHRISNEKYILPVVVGHRRMFEVCPEAEIRCLTVKMAGKSRFGKRLRRGMSFEQPETKRKVYFSCEKWPGFVEGEWIGRIVCVQSARRCLILQWS